MVKLKPGEIRNLLKPVEQKKVVIDGRPVKVKTETPVTIYKDRWGRYTVLERGRRLGAAEKRLGLKRSRGKEADWIKKEFEEFGPRITLRKTGGKQSKSLRSWEVNGLKGWVNLKDSEFISKNYPTHIGDMEKLMFSLSMTQCARRKGWDFESIWRGLDENQQFQAISKLIGFNWANFFETYVDSDGVGGEAVNLELQEQGLRKVLKILGVRDALEL